MKKILLFGFLLVGVCVIFRGFAIAQGKHETIKLDGLTDEVRVSRDSRSILYISAKNDDDLYFVQGYETAKDRLWQLDLLRRVASGRLSELFGTKTIEQDEMWRQLGFTEIANKTLGFMDPRLRTSLEAYARGVNAYIATRNKDNVPIEFKVLSYQPEQWKPTDTILVWKIISMGLSTTWNSDIEQMNLAKNLSKEKFSALTSSISPDDVVLFGSDKVDRKGEFSKRFGDFGASKFEALDENTFEKLKRVRKESLLIAGFYAKDLAASNNWVISGKLTADGNALLANDPHLPANAPGIWHMVQLSSPNANVAGVTFPGTPGVVLGHNENIAWGATNVGPDVQDVYFETFNENREYLSAVGWKPIEIRKEPIKFRENPLLPKLSTKDFEVEITENGPIIAKAEEGKKIALKWTALDPKNREFEAFYFLNRAGNWDEFNSALSDYDGSTQNFVYADKKGNIGWHIAGKIPIRRKGYGSLPYDGTTNAGDWVGKIPYDELPHLFNPKNGFIVTANQRVTGLDYKYPQIVRQIAPPWRALEIKTRIEATKDISVGDIEDFQFDSRSVPYSRLAKRIINANAADAETIAILTNWDGRANADSIAPILLDSIDQCMGDRVATENKPATSWMIRNRVLPWAIESGDKLFLPNGFENWNALISHCNTETKLNLKKKYGENPAQWKWGEYRKANFQHPLAGAMFIGERFRLVFSNVDGSAWSPNVGASVSMRFIAKPSNWDETRQVIPLGQSGDPDSPFWKDQFEAWRTGKTPVFPFTESAVLQAAETTLTYTP
ncbi:MAG: penicillin acylase family protein [Pyrinomonadaceae bacterium]